MPLLDNRQTRVSCIYQPLQILYACVLSVTFIMQVIAISILLYKLKFDGKYLIQTFVVVYLYIQLILVSRSPQPEKLGALLVFNLRLFKGTVT